jgi:peptidoglycan/LPS O-acetylase OafA/YrhL
MWFDIGALMFLTGVFSMIVLLFRKIKYKMQFFWIYFVIMLIGGSLMTISHYIIDGNTSIFRIG